MARFIRSQLPVRSPLPKIVPSTRLRAGHHAELRRGHRRAAVVVRWMLSTAQSDAAGACGRTRPDRHSSSAWRAPRCSRLIIAFSAGDARAPRARGRRSKRFDLGAGEALGRILVAQAHLPGVPPPPPSCGSASRLTAIAVTPATSVSKTTFRCKADVEL